MTNKILIIGPTWIGDMVMAQCLFKLLKARQPNSLIDVLAPTWSLPLLSRMPEVASAIPLEIGHGELALRKRYQLARSLRKQGYAQAILLPNSFKSALVPFWAKIPLRTGWLGEMRYFLLNDVRNLDKKNYPLMIERFLALGLEKNESLTNIKLQYCPELQVSQESCNQALANHHLSFPMNSVLALCPGAEFGAAKRWPEKYFAEIAKTKIAEGWDVWLFGSQKDTLVADRIMELTNQQCKNLTGKTKLAEAIDLLSLSTLVLSNDSGLMHVAAALKKPVVAVYGPTSFDFTPPLSDIAKVLTLQLDCQPCFQRECPLKHHRCMEELKPEKVLSAMQNLLMQTAK